MWPQVAEQGFWSIGPKSRFDRAPGSRSKNATT
jgi:hypothetical protein